MKKLMIAAIALFVGTTAFSQSIDLGIKAGANFASFSDLSGLSNKTGFHAGVFGGVKFSDKFGIQADILYSQQGADTDLGKFDLNYVNVPVVVKYYLFHGLNLQAGPQFGFVVDDNVKEVFNNLLEAENSNVSGVVGAGYDLPMGLRVDARYNFGLTDVIKGGDDVKSKSNVFSVALGYSFL